MNRIFPAKTILALLLAFVSMYSYAIIPSRSSSVHTENSTTSVIRPSENLSASIAISVANEEQVSAHFSISLRINREDYVFFRTDGLSTALEAIGSRDYARLVGKFDGSWYGIDIWDEEILDTLGASLTESLRSFIANLREYETSPRETIHLSERTDDDIALDIAIDFDSDYSEPSEYTDFSDFVL